MVSRKKTKGKARRVAKDAKAKEENEIERVVKKREQDDRGADAAARNR